MTTIAPERKATAPAGNARVFATRLSNTGAVGPAIVLTLMGIIYFIVRPSALNVDGIHTILNAATMLALAAAGASIVTIAGGFDFSVGAALSVVNVVIATQIGTSLSSQVMMIPLALAVGVFVGLINGLLVIWLKIASIVATLATSFFWGGVALLFLSQPGGAVPSDFGSWFTGTIAGVIPNALPILVGVVACWLVLKRTRLGRALYAAGGDIQAARLNGINTSMTVIAAYMIAGLLYGMSGLFLTAVTSSGDPNIGGPLLLPVFTAIAIGGVRFGGGRGDIVGAIVGAFILYMISDLLFAFGVSSFYTSILNGAVLLVAVAITSVAGSRRRVATSWLPRILGKWGKTAAQSGSEAGHE